MWDDHTQELDDDRGRDVRHDAQGKNRELEQCATGEEVDELVETRGVLVGRKTGLNVREVDVRAGDERPESEQGNDDEREHDLATKIGGAEDPPNSAKHQ